MTRAIFPSHDSRPTRTIEDYLMTMSVMERDQGEIVAARLAERMGVAPPTVTMTLKRMERDGWITGTGRKAVRLTETGRAAAHSVIRRHMLAEWLLVEMLKVPLEQVHEEAHGIEHAISPQLEARLREALGDRQVCPHGNPFPGCESVVQAWTALTDLRAGEGGVLRRIHEFAEDDPQVITFLYARGLTPGASLRVQEVLPFNQTLTVEVQENALTLGFAVARYLFVERT
ncbi:MULTISPECIES: metal-dependent transcriptional regulator [Anaerolinea]|uniref:metal-dependent transcriptional regulator n=1 Tax=Anaerolinea TaxID=233189 RepID=UPI0026191444|nr:metal-dependent transcriptional regulator [Anaerolinea thermophila]